MTRRVSTVTVLRLYIVSTICSGSVLSILLQDDCIVVAVLRFLQVLPMLACVISSQVFAVDELIEKIQLDSFSH